MTKFVVAIVIIVGAVAFMGKKDRFTSQPARGTNTSPTYCSNEIALALPTGITIQAERATTPQTRTQGLSNRSKLTPRTGMLFLFPKTGIYAFWMKDTLIPLDIIWLQDKKVVEIASLDPAKTLTIPQHTPNHQANAVLELNRDESQSLGIQVGTQLTWDDCQSAIQ